MAPSSAHSTRNVALLAQGIWPRSVTAPRSSRVRTSADDVAVAPRAHVARRLARLAAHGARRPAGLDQRAATVHERRRLGARQEEPRGGAARLDRLLRRRRRLDLTGAFRLDLLLDPLVGHDEDPLVLLVVADRDGADVPRGLDRLDERVLARRRLARAELDQEPGEVLGERRHVLLLALERHESPPLPSLKEEDALAGLADGARGEVVRCVELEGLAHAFTSDARAPSVEFTVSTV